MFKYYITLIIAFPLWLVMPKYRSWKSLKSGLKPHKHIYGNLREDGFRKCKHYGCNTIKNY